MESQRAGDDLDQQETQDAPYLASPRVHVVAYTNIVGAPLDYADELYSILGHRLQLKLVAALFESPQAESLTCQDS